MKARNGAKKCKALIDAEPFRRRRARMIAGFNRA